MDVDDNQRRIPVNTSKLMLFIVLIVTSLLVGGGFYTYKLRQIPTRIAESDNTMLLTDSMRHTFKVMLLNQKAMNSLIIALRNSDEKQLQHSADQMSASLGFIYIGYINNELLIKKTAPRIRQNIALLEANGLAIDSTDLDYLSENMSHIFAEVESIEQQIWTDFQEEFITFQTNEYRVQLVFQLIALISTIFMLGIAFMFFRQRQLLNVVRSHEQRLQYQAHYDALTGLPNRVLALDRLSQQLKEAERDATNVALYFIDLDDFKKVNDSLGHEVGDLLLQEAAQRLQSVLQDVDTVGRLGGDEFVVIIGDIHTQSDSAISAEALLAQFSTPFFLEGREFMLTTSIGIAIYPTDGTEPQSLLKSADSAMYHVKETGRNGYCYFTESMNAQISRRLEVEEQMHSALKHNEFYVLFQPQVDIDSGKIVSVEALVRWNSPVLGQVFPDEFIPIAEHSDLINTLGHFVLLEALKHVKRWRSEWDSEFKVAVNLSPRQFRDTGLVRNIESAISAFQLEGQCLELEITEGLLLDRNNLVETSLNDIVALGIHLAMDDFGTGYSSLSYLRKYSFNVIKIDRSFVSDIASSQANKKLVNSAIAMTHGLGLKVVAEGVETEEQLGLLAKMNCDRAQGYFISKPMSAAEIDNLLMLESRAVKTHE